METEGALYRQSKVVLIKGWLIEYLNPFWLLPHHFKTQITEKALITEKQLLKLFYTNANTATLAGKT